MPGGVPRPTRPLPGAALPRILVSRSAVGGYQGERERENETAICLWDALSGRSNAHILEAIGGEWRRLRHRHLLRARLGAQPPISRGIVLDAHGPRVNGYLFLSDRLAAHWPMLDDFEEGYDRVPVEVTTDDGQQISAWIYQLQPRG